MINVEDEIQSKIHTIENMTDCPQKTIAALQMYLTLHACLTEHNVSLINHFKDKLKKYIPDCCLFENAIRHPIKLRSLVVGMGEQAASLVIFAIKHDIEDDDDMYLTEVRTQQGPNKVSISYRISEDQALYLHGVPFSQLAVPILIDRQPNTFNFRGWYDSSRKFHEIEDSVSTWPKVFGSLNRFVKEGCSK